jgi:hypothetical protein
VIPDTPVAVSTGSARTGSAIVDALLRFREVGIVVALVLLIARQPLPTLVFSPRRASVTSCSPPQSSSCWRRGRPLSC